MIINNLFTIFNKHYLYKRHKEKLDIIFENEDSKKSLESIFEFFETQKKSDDLNNFSMLNKNIDKEYKNTFVFRTENLTLEYSFHMLINISNDNSNIDQFNKNSNLDIYNNSLLIKSKIFIKDESPFYINFKITTKNNNKNGDIYSKLEIETKISSILMVKGHKDVIGLTMSKNNKILSFEINKIKILHDIDEKKLLEISSSFKNNLYNYMIIEDNIIDSLNIKETADLILKGGIPKEKVDFLLLNDDDSSFQQYIVEENTIFDILKNNKKSKILKIKSKV